MVTRGGEEFKNLKMVVMSFTYELPQALCSLSIPTYILTTILINHYSKVLYFNQSIIDTKYQVYCDFCLWSRIHYVFQLGLFSRVFLLASPPFFMTICFFIPFFAQLYYLRRDLQTSISRAWLIHQDPCYRYSTDGMQFYLFKQKF